MTKADEQSVFDHRAVLLERAWEAYQALPSPPRLFPPGVRKYHSVYEADADRDQHVVDWYLSQQPKS
jgi:hypothetical protein